jgi:type VI secretion system protein ImpG
MDTRLLRHYESELAYLREMGAEFADLHPKIAARLGIEATDVLDPYVERLLEGSAFLAARVQLEQELQYATFTNHLFEIVYPQALAPLPSMMVAQLNPDMGNAALAQGHLFERNTRLTAFPAERSRTRCEYRTAHDVTLWPVEITEVEYLDGRAALVATQATQALEDIQKMESKEARAGLRLRLQRFGGAPLSELSLDRLSLFLPGKGGVEWDLHEVLSNEVLGIVGRSVDRRDDWVEPLPQGRSRVRGFDRAEALLPTPQQSFDGYRLLQEYFALPERFRFIDLDGLGPAISSAQGDSVDLIILLREGRPEFTSTLQPENFALHCTPAINLFERRCDRVDLNVQDAEHHVVVDKTAPMDHEVYAITSVTGIQSKDGPDVLFLPFYAAGEFTPLRGVGSAYYTKRRRMRHRSQKEELRGERSSYLGSELYLDLVDAQNAPYDVNLKQLALRVLVTNRDLPLLLATGSSDVFKLSDGGPVSHITTLVAPTRPRPSMVEGERAWRLISQLSLNYLSLVDTEGGHAADALREMLGAHAPADDRVIERQLEGLIRVAGRPIVRRLADETLSTAVRGLEVEITCDESYFKGASAYLLGAVLDQFFTKYVTMNSFVETVLSTETRGEVARWPPRKGSARLI